MQQVKVLRNVDVLKALLNKWRSKLLQLLIAKEYTVKQLADLLEINPGTVYHHIKVLQDAGLIEETRTQIEKNIVMRFYRAVAREFKVDFSVLSGERDKDVTQWVASRVAGLIETLKAYGIVIAEESHEEAIERIKEYINFENKLKEEISPKKPEMLKNKEPSIIRDAFSLMTLYRLNQDQEYVKLRDNLLHFLKKHDNV